MRKKKKKTAKENDPNEGALGLRQASAQQGNKVVEVDELPCEHTERCEVLQGNNRSLLPKVAIEDLTRASYRQPSRKHFPRH